MTTIYFIFIVNDEVVHDSRFYQHYKDQFSSSAQFNDCRNVAMYRVYLTVTLKNNLALYDDSGKTCVYVERNRSFWYYTYDSNVVSFTEVKGA